MSQPTDRRDAHSVAKMLISRYGEQAASYAAYQALKARERGDQRAMNGWYWVAGAVREIWSTEPEEGERSETE